MRVLALSVAGLGLLTGPAAAADVTFSGTLLGLCSVVLTTPGLLALSGDGTVFGSEEIGGLAAAVSILAVGSALLVGAPVLTGSPGAYDPTGQSLEVSYSGLSGLNLVNQGYTANPTSFAIDSLPLSVVVMNNRIVNPAGFVAGTYQTRTVVTCS